MGAPASEQEVSFPCGRELLAGLLSIPKGAKALVVIAHGSGSTHRSARNAEVAGALYDAGFASLRADLLTPQEAELNERTGQYQFDVATLAERVLAASTFVGTLEEAQLLPLAYFGASTGAAAVLTAAVKRRDVYAIVSRGGRPDLAMHSLPEVRAATLFIVGGADVPIIPLTEEAFTCLTSEKELAVVPDATHLFEEPGALEMVSRLTVEWLMRFLPQSHG